MRRLFYLTLLALVFYGCRKNLPIQKMDVWLQRLQTELLDSLGATNFQNLQSATFYKTILPEGKVIVQVRISASEKEWLLLESDTTGHLLRGIWIYPDLAGEFNNKLSGTVAVKNLNKKHIRRYLLADNQLIPEKEKDVITESFPVQDNPVGIYVHPYWLFDFLSYSPGPVGYLMDYRSFFDGGGGGGGSTGSYYWNITGSGSAPLPQPGPGPSIDPQPEPDPGSVPRVVEVDAIYLERPKQDNKPGIDLNAYLSCFESLPDQNANCEIELLTDIPVNDNPYVLTEINSLSPGHTFLRLLKSSGGKTVQQVIGFYPESGYKAVLNDAPVASKAVDNTGHEFNASITTSVSAADFRLAIKKITENATKGYSIKDFNCTHFALEAFNAARGQHPLSVPTFVLPGGTTSAGSISPHSLYIALEKMIEDNHPEASKIQIPGIAGYVGNSNGPCK
ncbi:MAG: hypothetical protein ACO1NW_11865 [Chitinophagaceae bacterium]